jgi:hypothetical protein
MAYITTAQLKTYMGIDSSSDDALLAACIDRAQSVINSYTNRVFESLADSTRYYTPIIDRIGSGLGYSGDLSDDYTLSTNYDLISVTTIVNGTGDSIPVNAVVTLPLNFTPAYAVRIKQASGYFWSYVGSPEASVSITGRWGYSLTAPANIQQACLRIASGYYRQRDGSPDISDSVISADGSAIVSSAMRSDVLQLLKPYRRTT